VDLDNKKVWEGGLKLYVNASVSGPLVKDINKGNDIIVIVLKIV